MNRPLSSFSAETESYYQNGKLMFLFILISLLCFGSKINAQVNGVIVSDTNNITILKVWGNHYERGFAYGYLMGAQINQVFNSYLKPQFGGYYSLARSIIINEQDIKIDSIYWYEAKAIADGMDSAGTNQTHMDFIDLLVCNSFLDIAKLMNKSFGLGCSSLMSWGQATEGTNLDGKASVCRHLDWNKNSVLINNQVIIVHLPSEEHLQDWAMVGFAGMFSVLSGFNRELGVFQHMMDDFSGNSPSGKAFEPVWFSLRKAIEYQDYNQDGSNNALDLKAVLSESENGYAEGYILTALAGSHNMADSTIALVAEVAPIEPYLSFRNSAYADSIPGDNLYAANYQIARDSAMNFCNRYQGIKQALFDGTGIGIDNQWSKMRDYSGLSHNLQFMQFIPELDIFRLANIVGTTTAHTLPPVEYSISDLFSPALTMSEIPTINFDFRIFPNPTKNFLHIELENVFGEAVYIKIYDSNGKLSQQEVISGSARKISKEKSYHTNHTLRLQNLHPGIYFMEVKRGIYKQTKSFMVFD